MGYRLRRETGLSDLSCAALRRLIGAGIAVESGHVLIAQGEPDSAALRTVVVLRGWACRARSLPDGRRLVTELLLPGDIASARPGRSDHEVAALSPCTVAMVAPNELADCALLFGARHALTRVEDQAGRILREGLVNLALRDAPTRIAHLLCEVRARLIMAGAADPAGFAFDWPLTQEALGEIAGLSAVHVNRSLKTLRQSGMADVRLGRVVVPDPERLAAFCGFDPGYLALSPEGGDARG